MLVHLPQIEKKILNFWQKNKIFEKSLQQNKGKKLFSFYDGPPFATGKPHYGHILATTIKDAVLRYWTMKGYYVPRRVGWDCHGLPVENLIEKELKIKNKKEIEKLGIEKFNQLCRESVFRCVKDFETTLKRVGRWADYKNAYATLDNDYIESVWWIFSQLWRQNLVYRSYRISPYCPRCGTPLSNFEVNLGYKETKDNSVYLKFKIVDPRFSNTYFLVWTTTPWTLFSNVALAVNPTTNYCLVESGNDSFILNKARLSVLADKYQIIKTFKGQELVGLKYQPLFETYLNYDLAEKNKERIFQVWPADFVSTEEGTGFVHIAPPYGQEDFDLSQKYQLPFFHTVDEDGFFKPEVKKWAGRFVKEVENEIIADLEERGLLYKKEEIVHSYPFCWRCDTPLLYYALATWYIAVTKLKKNLLANNQKIYWVPKHIKAGRFGKWLTEAKDWAFARNRFWGAPIPIWHCQAKKSQISNLKSQNSKFKYCQNIKVVGSLEELKKLSGKKPKDLHRPYIDEIVLTCPKCGGQMRRIPEVFDCWFESGSMPYAQWHYPFENKKLVEATFPADFIAEGLDQTRGWFYTLHVLAAALTLKDIGLDKNQPAFKNAIVNGLILDAQGKKLSKRLKNYPEPSEIFEKYGADALRYFLLASTPIGEDYLFSEKGVESIYRNTILTFWHSYLFFQTYREKDFQPKKQFKVKNLLNQWILSRLQSLVKEVDFYLKQYELTKASRLPAQFIDDLSNWYIRRSRKKFQNPSDLIEKEEASQVLHTVLITLSKIMAPFTPFLTDFIYQNLKSKKEPLSVHLCALPAVKSGLIKKDLEKKMAWVREIVTLALAERIKAGIKVRQPLAKLKIKSAKLKIKPELLELIKEEVNVKEIIFDKKMKKEIELDTKITPELKEEGLIREIIRHIQAMRKKAGLQPADKVWVVYQAGPELQEVLLKNKERILKEAKIKDLILIEKKLAKLLIKQELNLEGQTFWLGLVLALDKFK
ncbi:MAG: isoleucine--tRNA ligase [Minisyncoccales bacterium]